MMPWIKKISYLNGLEKEGMCRVLALATKSFAPKPFGRNRHDYKTVP